MKTESFGYSKNAGREATLITVEGKNGMSFSVTDYGAALVSICVPDRSGKPVDVCLGYTSVEGFEKNWGYLGAVIGRITNRIDGAKFTFQGKEYLLEDNNDGMTLHGGERDWTRGSGSISFWKKKMPWLFILPVLTAIRGYLEKYISV